MQVNELKEQIKNTVPEIKKLKKLLSQDHNELGYRTTSNAQFELWKLRRTSRAQHLIYAWLRGQPFSIVEPKTRRVGSDWECVVQYDIIQAAKPMLEEDYVEHFKKWIKDT